MRNIITAAALLLSTSAAAHEMTPTYFQLVPSMVTNIWATKMNIFNRREDTHLYQMEAYTADWEALPFASFDREFNLDYGEGITVELYFRNIDKDRVTYICSRSVPDGSEVSAVTSLICSKVRD